MPKWTPVRRQAVLYASTKRDIAPLLVGVPKWTRLNFYATRPDTLPHQPLAEAMIVAAYLRSLPPSLKAQHAV